MSALKFLSQKSFHPATKRNQKKVWIAEQEATEREKKERERDKFLHEETQRNTLKYGSATVASLDFMYAPPPGYVDEKAQQKKSKKEEGGEDDEGILDSSTNDKDNKEERPEDRFSFLKNAPVQGRSSSNVPMSMVTSFKPLGIEIRNVKCLRCNQWGHSIGDKVCPMVQVKSEKEQHKQEREDPLRTMGMQFSKIGDTGLSLRVHTLGRAMTNPDEANQQLLNSDEEDEEEDLEQQFLASLTKAQKRKLLRHFKREERRKRREERRLAKRQREDHHHHHHHSSLKRRNS